MRVHSPTSSVVPAAIRSAAGGSFARSWPTGPLIRDCSSKHAGSAESTHGPCPLKGRGVAAASGAERVSTVGVPVGWAEIFRSGGARRCANTIPPNTMTIAVAMI